MEYTIDNKLWTHIYKKKKKEKKKREKKEKKNKKESSDPNFQSILRPEIEQERIYLSIVYGSGLLLEETRPTRGKKFNYTKEHERVEILVELFPS